MNKFIFFSLLLFSCSNTKKLKKEENLQNSKTVVNSPPVGGFGGEDLDKQGHRGCRGLMPENTIPAMLNAIGYGVTTLEMDISITKDKKVILSHEPYFNHEISTKPDGNFIDVKDEKSFNIYQMTYEQVKTYDVGMKPHPRFPKQEKMKVVKPLLSDLIDAVNKDMMTRRRPFPLYNIETKSLPVSDNIYHPAPAEFVELLMAVIKEKKIEELTTIQSFDFRTLQYLHKHYPEMRTAMLIEGSDKRGLDAQLKALGFTPTIYSPAYQLVNDELIKKCHEKKIKIIPWTVNDKAKIEELKKMGVDGIITDYPDLFY